MERIHVSPKRPIIQLQAKGPPVSCEWGSKGTPIRYAQPASSGLTHLLCQVFLDALPDAGWGEAEGPAVVRGPSGRLQFQGIGEER